MVKTVKKSVKGFQRPKHTKKPKGIQLWIATIPVKGKKEAPNILLSRAAEQLDQAAERADGPGLREELNDIAAEIRSLRRCKPNKTT